MRAYYSILITLAFFLSTHIHLHAQTVRYSTIILDEGNRAYPSYIQMTDDLFGGRAEKDDLLFKTDGGIFFKLDANNNGISGDKGFSIVDGKNHPIFVVDEDDHRVGINTDSPEYTLQVSHKVRDTHSDNYQQGLNIKNTDYQKNWTLYAQSRGNFNLFAGKEFKGYFDDYTGQYYNRSDARFKSNIDYLEKGELSKIMQLKPSTYMYNTVDKAMEQRKVYGLIAQDLQEIYPEMVGTIGAEEGLEEERLVVSYTELIPVLIAGMQEQQQQIALLQNEIADLKNRAEVRTTVVKKEASLENAPNPSSEQTTISYKLLHPAKATNIYLHDMNGRLIESFDLGNQTYGNLTIELKDYPRGIYKYSLVADGEIVITKSLVVQ